jgi:hypothetical protein
MSVSPCSRHRCGCFTATHVIQTPARRYYVHAELEGNLVALYTGPEWDSQRKASWNMREGVLFFGNAAVKGATLSTFDDSPTTAEDGWSIEGTPEDGARFVQD